MNKFYFVAVTKEGKNISGFIDAYDEKDAHDRLVSGKMAVLTLEPYDADKHQNKNLVTFDFAGRSNNHPVSGTIEAKDEYSAYKKLRLDYEVDVSWMVPHDISESDKEILKQDGIDEELEKRVQFEKEQVEKKLKKEGKLIEKVDDEAEIQQALASRQKEIQFMRDQIDEVIGEIRPMLEEYGDVLDPVKRREIGDRLDLLSRLKRSNSVDHLKKLTDRVLKELESDEIFLGKVEDFEKLPPEVQERIGKFRKKSGGFNKAISKGLMEIQFQIAGLAPSELSKKVVEARPLRKFFKTIYLTFAVLFVMTVVFWLWAVIENSERSDFYFTSPILWYATGFSGIIGLSFPHLFLYKKHLTKKQVIIPSVSCVLALLIFTLEFPVLFQ